MALQTPAVISECLFSEYIKKKSRIKKKKVKNKKEKQAKTSELHSRPAESASLAGNKIQCAKQGLTDYQLISSIFRAMLDLEINSQ